MKQPMKRYYISVQLKEGDVGLAPDKNIIEDVQTRETAHYFAILSSSTGKVVAPAAFDAAVAAIKEVTGQK